jgi:superfamily II DNA or RNA helicase
LRLPWEKGSGDEGKQSLTTDAVEDRDLQIQEEEDEELTEAWTVGKTARFELQHLDIEAWLQDLGRDRRQLHALFLQAQDVDGARDAKLGKLKALIAAKVQAPTVNKKGELNRKVLVFTAFADTARYLYDHLKDWARGDLGVHCALVTGGDSANQTTFGSRRFEHILTHFSPRSKQRALLTSLPQGEEIDLLIATDCISEGQNLQDCDYLINYDIHWNPVRIIQRFGRIDRLGSLNSAARLVNFWPVPDLNQYIAFTGESWTKSLLALYLSGF